MAEIIDLDPVPQPLTNPRFPEDQPASTLNDGDRDSEGITARWYRDNNGSLTSTGTATAYTLTPNRNIPSLYDGLSFVFNLHVTSGASPMLAVAAQPAAPMVWPNDVPIKAGELAAGAKVQAVYSAGKTQWQITSVPGAPVSLSADNTWTGNNSFTKPVLIDTPGVNNLDLKSDVKTDNGAVARVRGSGHNTADADLLCGDIAFVRVSDTEGLIRFLTNETAAPGAGVPSYSMGKGFFAEGLSDPGAGKADFQEVLQQGQPVGRPALVASIDTSSGS